MAPFNRPYTTFCWSAIANIYSNCTVLSYLMLNNIVTLKSGLAVRYSMSFKLVPFDSKAWVQFPIRFPTMALSCIISETKRDNGRKSWFLYPLHSPPPVRGGMESGSHWGIGMYRGCAPSAENFFWVATLAISYCIIIIIINILECGETNPWCDLDQMWHSLWAGMVLVDVITCAIFWWLSDKIIMWIWWEQKKDKALITRSHVSHQCCSKGDTKIKLERANLPLSVTCGIILSSMFLAEIDEFPLQKIYDIGYWIIPLISSLLAHGFISIFPLKTGICIR